MTNLKDKTKNFFQEVGVTILPDMTGPVGSLHGKTIYAITFKIERSQFNSKGFKKLLEGSNWSSIALYQVLTFSNFIIIRGHVE